MTLENCCVEDVQWIWAYQSMRWTVFLCQCQWKRQQLGKRAIVQEFQMEFSFEGRMLEGATEDLKYGKDKKSCVDQTWQREARTKKYKRLVRKKGFVPPILFYDHQNMFYIMFYIVEHWPMVNDHGHLGMPSRMRHNKALDNFRVVWYDKSL